MDVLVDLWTYEAFPLVARCVCVCVCVCVWGGEVSMTLF